MPGSNPIAEQPYNTGAAATTAWAEARDRLEKEEWYWLATGRPDGRPHVAPVLAVWVDGALHFAAGPATRKARNLAHDPHCVVTTGHDLHLVVEGEAVKVTDETRLQRVAEVYDSKYEWRVTVRDGAFHDTEGAPTAGPPPYDVYEVRPTTVLGFPADERFTPTRWRF